MHNQGQKKVSCSKKKISRVETGVFYNLENEMKIVTSKIVTESQIGHGQWRVQK